MEMRQAMQLEFRNQHDTNCKTEARNYVQYARGYDTHRLDRVVQRGSCTPMTRFAYMYKSTMSDNVTNIRLTIEKNGAILEDPFPILVFVGYVEHQEWVLPEKVH